MCKSIIALILLAVIFLNVTLFYGKQESDYTLYTKVVEVDLDENIVTCVDRNGNFWEFPETEDWMEGDYVKLSVNQNGEITETLYIR